MVTLILDVEMLHDDAWESLRADISPVDPIAFEYAFRGGDSFNDPIAPAGELQFSLANGVWNSGLAVGYYSPRHPNCRPGFTYGVPIRLSMGYAGMTPSKWYKFYGKLGNVVVVPGVHEERLVRCQVLDIMDDFSRTPAPALETKFDREGALLVQDIIEALPEDLQPNTLILETSQIGNFPVAFDTLREDSKSVREAIGDVVRSYMGRVFPVGVGPDNEPGGALSVHNRQYAAVNPTLFAEFGGNDILVGSMTVPGSRDDVVRSIEVVTHPTKTDDAPVALYSLENASLLVQNGETFTGLTGSYRHPNNPSGLASVGGTSMVTPVAYTDYTMNSAADGSGLDLTADFVVVADFFATAVHFSFTNNSGNPGYVTFLQTRGLGIYRFTSSFKYLIDETNGGQDIQIDMPIQSDANVGRDVALYLGNRLSKQLPRVTSLTFVANADTNKMFAAICGEPGMRISVTEGVTGLDHAEFTVSGIRMELVQADRTLLANCTWFLEPADTQKYWQFDVAGSSEFDVSTVLGF